MAAINAVLDMQTQIQSSQVSMRAKAGSLLKANSSMRVLLLLTEASVDNPPEHHVDTGWIKIS